MHTTRSRAVVVAVAVVALVGAAAAAVAFWLRPAPGAAAAPTSSSSTPAAPTVSASTPASTSSAAPVEPVEPTEPPPPPVDPAPGDPLAGTTLTVTFSGYDAAAGALVMGGYVDVVLSGGSCTVSATKGGTTLTGTSTAVPDASTTSCGTVPVSGDGLTSGTWSATLTFSTATGSVAAAPVTIEVAR